MDKTENVSPSQTYDKSVGFPEEVRHYHRYHSADPRRIWEYFGLLLSMLWDSFNGKYPLPMKTSIVMVFAFLYLISPVDIVLDILPLIGFADDIAVLFFAASFIKDDVDNYRLWKVNN
jgi:uncharacterized membrane protein YkvA (DUF1232 family)